MNKILLLAAGALALATGCAKNNDNGVAATANEQVKLYCASVNNAQDLVLSVRTDGIRVSQFVPPNSAENRNFDTASDIGDRGPAAPPVNAFGNNPANPNENRIPSSRSDIGDRGTSAPANFSVATSGVMFARGNEAASADNLVSFHSTANDESSSATLKVDGALLAGAPTGTVLINDQPYNCATDQAIFGSSGSNSTPAPTPTPGSAPTPTPGSP